MARGGAGHKYFAHYDPEQQAAHKKDDDSKTPAGASATSGTWAPNKVRIRGRRRRIWVVIGAAFMLFILFKSIPDDFWEPNETGARRIAEFHSGTDHAGGIGLRYQPQAVYGSQSKGQEIDPDERKPPPLPKSRVAKVDDHYYDGEILFRRLPTTLHTIQRTLGYRKINNNVLFAASSLKSFGTILPLACAMTKQEASYVHVTIFGRSELTLDDILHVNGIDRAECKAYWHDARPNWAQYSSDFRAEASVASALEHIEEFMHPQVVIMDDSSLEDQWFTRQVRAKASKHEWPVVELPGGASERLQWLSRLDAPALRAFQKTSIDILVQAPMGEAGNLIRLLQSLKDADYRGLPVPKLTIELPSDVDPTISWAISSFKWPPHTSPFQPGHSSQLNIRQRIPGQSLSSEEASTRFLESFYPVDAKHSHVLVLNNNVELSPLYLHWLMYNILHYKHSHASSQFSDQLLGMSLDIPATYLNGSTELDTSILDESGTPRTWPGRSDPRELDTRPPFLWQAPNPNAAVIFGDRWTELHSFLKSRLRATKEHKIKAKKIVGEHLPAWSEYVLEIMRARGWNMLCPASGKVEGMAIVHKDLWQAPEEFKAEYQASLKAKTKVDTEEKEPPSTDDKEPLRGIEAHWKTSDVSLTSNSRPLHEVLPFRGEEPFLRTLPSMLYDGTLLKEQSDIGPHTDDYADEFRKSIGGCKKHEGSRKVIPSKADDLFCWGTEKESGWENGPTEHTGGEGAAKGM